eukprot:comp21587_c1_seq1/m.30182 comp21587_c1_seq1/g.30182  ORF comp21587_c1_seq1/g.30182 comp21587_c1_seq1/m.30182 type:complete len:660 (-) comp21587_c1_seq1:187-2166(-)
MKVALRKEAAVLLGRISLAATALFLVVLVVRWATGTDEEVPVVSPLSEGKMDSSRKQVIIINAATALGMHLAVKLQQRGDQVLALDTLSHKNVEERHMKEERYGVLKSNHVPTMRGNGCEMTFLAKMIDNHFKDEGTAKIKLSHVVFFTPALTDQHGLADMLTCFANVATVLRKQSPQTVIVYEGSGARLSSYKDGYVPRASAAMSAATGNSMDAVANMYHNLYAMKVAGVHVPELVGQWVGPGSVAYELTRHGLLGSSITADSGSKIGLVHVSAMVECFVKLLDIKQAQHMAYGMPASQVSVVTVGEVAKMVGKALSTSVSLTPPPGTGFSWVKDDGHPEEDVNGLPWIRPHFPIKVEDRRPVKDELADYVMWARHVIGTSQQKEEAFRAKALSVLPKNVTEQATIDAVTDWYRRGGGAGRSVVFSCYFSRKIDPQRGTHVQTNAFEYMEKWFRSIERLDLEAVIFHDGLSKKFIAEHGTEKIKFHRVELGTRSTNDERFFFYRDYLSENPDIKAVIMTDISDVVFRMDPFELIMVMGDYVYAGRDYGSSMSGNGWLTPREKLCFKAGFDPETVEYVRRKSQVYNAGIVGGYTDTIMEFLDHMDHYLHLCPVVQNCNMPVYNFVLHHYFDEKIYTGFPLNSRFFMKEEDPLGVYLIHK